MCKPTKAINIALLLHFLNINITLLSRFFRSQEITGPNAKKIDFHLTHKSRARATADFVAAVK